MFFSALEFQSRSGTTKLRTHRKVYKIFSQYLQDLLAASSYCRACQSCHDHSMQKLQTLLHAFQRLWHSQWCHRTSQHSQDLRTWKDIELEVCSLSSKPWKMLKGKFLPPHSLSPQRNTKMATPSPQQHHQEPCETFLTRGGPKLHPEWLTPRNRADIETSLQNHDQNSGLIQHK